MASSGVLTTGSFSLNDVFSTTGTPVFRSNAWISDQYFGFVDLLTVCWRAVPSTCVMAGTRACCSRLTWHVISMNGDGFGHFEPVGRALLEDRRRERPEALRGA